MGRISESFPRARRRWGELPRWARWPTYGAAALFALGLLAFAVLWLTVELPEEPPELESAVLLAAGGQELAILSKGGQRFEVPLDEVAPVVVEALIAAEDRRFYSHRGLDPIGVGRALWSNVRTADTQGGSTITQQLVKNQYLTHERTLWRKAREAVLAAKLERTADKDEILERYLNTVYFGRGAYGVEAAARAYFGARAAELDLPQAALLVGLLRSPETGDPADDPEEAKARRDQVLAAMVDTDDLTAEEAEAAAAAPVEATDTTAQPTELTAGMAPHFVEWARQQTIEVLGEDALYSNGLVVHTTLDLKAQAAAEQAVAEILTDPAAPQAAVVALDTDGAIRAHMGGRDFEALQVDLVRGGDGGGSGRQPGSTFKPFVLEAALERGITLGDRYAAPPTIDLTVDGQPWTVSNYGGSGFGDLSVAEATATSANTVYAQLLAEVGPQAVVDAAARMGIDAELEPFPSVALGVEEVSPLDLARAYLTLAGDGTRVEPYAISRIEDAEGTLLWEPDRPEPEGGAIDPEISRAVTHALRGVIENGSGGAADIGRPAAGKTGTTQENVDAWFAGYVPGYAAVVWMGFPEPAPMDDVQGRSVTGGSFPAEIWARFMAVAVEDREPTDFPPPPDELLAEGDPSELAVSPPVVDPGATITASGTGFGSCRVSWSVAVEGTDLASPPEQGSDAEERSATIQVPPDMAPGEYRAVALCDSGAGRREVASATFQAREPTTTTTTTTEPAEPTTTTTTPTTTTTTTTTAPGSAGGESASEPSTPP